VYIGLQVKCRIFLSYINESWKFVIDFRKTLKYKISWKSVQGKPRFFHSDGQTDITKPLTVAFRNFANSSDPVMKLQICHIIISEVDRDKQRFYDMRRQKFVRGMKRTLQNHYWAVVPVHPPTFLHADGFTYLIHCWQHQTVHVQRKYIHIEQDRTNKPPAGFPYSPSPSHQSREHGLCSKQYLLSGIVIKTQVVTMCNARWYLLLSPSIHM